MKLVIQNTSHVWGGNEKWLAALAQGLMARGHEVVVSCASGPVQWKLAERSIPTSPFRPRGSLDFVSGLTFAAWLRKTKPDTVLLTSWRPTSWATAAARAAGVRRVVMRLGIVRSFPGVSPRSLAVGSLDALIVNSEEIREEWLASAPRFRSNAVHVVLNGVRSRINERAALRAALRTELSLPDSTILFGGAGHIAPRKGFDILLRAFALAAITDSCLAIAGDGGHRTDLERLALELGIDSRVRWLGHRNDGAAVIGGFDLFVLSSHNEGMANVMLEAMAGGTPVIAVDVSGVSKAIGATSDRPAAGWIVEPGDPGALSEVLRASSVAVRDNLGVVDSMTDEAHWRALNWFSPERMVEECEAILFPQT